MWRSRRPVKRLLIVPALVMLGLVVGLQAFHTATTPPADEVVGLQEPPPETVRFPHRCQRGRANEALQAARETLTTGGRVTSTQVLACPQAFHGRRVTYVGEVVGDVLRRDGGAWVLVNDDAYALEVGPLPSHNHRRGTNSGLTVWLPDRLVEQVGRVGRPNQRGDVVEVQGHIRRTDPDDGGGLTVHADQLRVLSPAVRLEDPLDVPQLLLALGAMGAAVVMTGLAREARRR